MTELRLFTSESVTEGHPDKICDQISDSILDALLAEDPNSRVAVETLVTTGLVHVAGEVRTDGYVDIPEIVRRVVNRIGYTSSDTGFDGDSCGVSISIGEQSSDIATGVDTAQEHREGGSIDPLDAQGAGDQGIMFGYATNETPQLMPIAIWTAHRIAERLADARRNGAFGPVAVTRRCGTQSSTWTNPSNVSPCWRTEASCSERRWNFTCVKSSKRT